MTAGKQATLAITGKTGAGLWAIGTNQWIAWRWNEAVCAVDWGGKVSEKQLRNENFSELKASVLSSYRSELFVNMSGSNWWSPQTLETLKTAHRHFPQTVSPLISTYFTTIDQLRRLGSPNAMQYCHLCLHTSSHTHTHSELHIEDQTADKVFCDLKSCIYGA